MAAFDSGHPPKPTVARQPVEARPSPGGSFAVEVWDAHVGTPSVDLIGHAGPVTSVAFSPDGERLVTASRDSTAKVWDVNCGTHLLDLKGTRTGCWASRSAPTARIVTGCYVGTARVWDAQTGKPLLELKGHAGQVWSVAFSRDGTRIVTTATDVTTPTRQRKPAVTKVWDALTGEGLKADTIPQTMPNNWTSPDGRLFAHPEGDRVELIALRPDERELSRRLLHTRPNAARYRKAHEAAKTAKDDFAARFYLNLLKGE